MGDSQITQPPQGAQNIGSHLEPQYTRRSMKLYSLHEGEISTISNLNDQATLGYTIASFFISQALAIWITSTFSTDLSPAGELAKAYGIPFFILFGAIGIIWGLWSGRKRNRIWDEIKRNSQDL